MKTGSIKILFLCIVLSLSSISALADETVEVDSTALRLVKAGFVNVRSTQTDDFAVYTIENDDYKLPLEGFIVARHIIEQSSPSKPVKLIGTFYDVPEVTMEYRPETGSWSKTTKRLDSSWSIVSKEKKYNSNFGKVNLTFYPQIAIKNLIINHVYQSLFLVNPTLEVSLWKGMKFSYQVEIPLYNDGYGTLESKIHPEFVTLSQRFRVPYLNVFGRATLGTFSNYKYGAALEMVYYFPNERFSVDTQLAYLGTCYYQGFKFRYDTPDTFYWNFAFNFYWPSIQTQFTVRAQKFLEGDKGLKFEMIKHTRHSAIGLYAEKSIHARFNVGFRFHFALAPYHKSRNGYYPKLTTSGQMGMVYNSGNEQYYYKEFRTEASQNIMSKNAFNPHYLDYYFGK